MSPVMFESGTTQEERQAALIDDAKAGIAALRAKGDTATLARLAGIYDREATRAGLMAQRIEAESAFVAADVEFSRHDHASHGTDTRTAQALADGGLGVLSPRFLDRVEDPGDVRAGGAIFAELAALCR